MLHFNWIITLFEKEYRQREMLLYDYDDNNYYSAKNHKYFILHYNKSSVDMLNKITLFGFHISIITGRIFIVPQYNCKFSNRKMTNKTKKCTIADRYNINSFSKLKYLFRENVLIIIINEYILYSHSYLIIKYHFLSNIPTK